MHVSKFVCFFHGVCVCDEGGDGGVGGFVLRKMVLTF